MNYEETYRNFDEEYRNFDEEYKKLYAAAQTGRTLRDYFAAKAMQGLEALEELYNTNSSWWQEVDEQTIKKIENSITAIKEALAQTQEPKIGCVNHDCDKCKAQTQEPVAWLYSEGLKALQDSKCWTAYPTKHDGCNIPLYTTPPQRTERPVDCERCNRLEEQAYDLVGKLRVANIKLSMQPQRTEPVAWLEPEWGEEICPEVGFEATTTSDHPRDLCWIPLYPHPPQRTWVGLTDEDKKQMAKEANYHWEMTAGEYAERIGQLTEAKLKEKNT